MARARLTRAAAARTSRNRLIDVRVYQDLIKARRIDKNNVYESER